MHKRIVRTAAVLSISLLQVLSMWTFLCYLKLDGLSGFMHVLELTNLVYFLSGTFVLRSSNRRMPPHNERACEKCKESGRPCWIIKRKTSPSQSVAGSAAPDSELEALSNDLAKLIVDPSADSSLANSRTESPHDPQLNTGERGLYHSAPPPHVLQHGLMDSYNPAYYHPQQYGHTPMYYPGQPQVSGRTESLNQSSSESTVLFMVENGYIGQNTKLVIII